MTVTVKNRRAGLCTLHLGPTLLGRMCLLHNMMGTFIEMSEGQRMAVSAWVFELSHLVVAPACPRPAGLCEKRPKIVSKET